MNSKTFNGNQLKVIALAAMTIDHVTCVLFPGYPRGWWILALRIIGRMAAPFSGSLLRRTTITPMTGSSTRADR